jgi:hypothetical protein
MNDPLDYSNVGSEYVLSEEDRNKQLSNEQIEEIQQRVDTYEQQQLQLQEQEAQPPTGGQTAPTSEQPAPTGEVTMQPEMAAEPFDPSKDYSYYEAQGMSRGEWNRLQMGGGIGSDVEGFATDPRYAMELATAVPVGGVLDPITDLANKFLPKSAQIPKVTPYENGVSSAVRAISSVVVPTLALQSAGMAAATKAQTATTKALGSGNVINRLGNTAFMKFLGTRGVEAGAAVAVGAVSSEYEEDNAFGTLKKALPPQYDFIPDSWATLDTDSPDEKRIKNINEDLGLGFLIPFVGFLGKFGAAIDEVGQTFSKAPKIVGETPQAQKIINDITPVAKSDDAVEELSRYAAKQEADLDELGYYNQAMNPNSNVPLKGVNDLYDWNEVGMRSADDFGIIGASIDAVRVAKNKGSVYGRLGNFISEPARKFAISTPGGVEEVSIGLAKQLKDADRYRVDAADWAISFDEIQEQGDNLVLELFDPTVGVDEIRKILDPVIVKNQFGLEELTDEGYRGIFRMIDDQAKAFTGMDIAKAQAYSATSISGQIADLSEGIRLNRGSAAVDQAKEQIRDNLAYLQQLQGTTKYYLDKKRGIMRLGERVRAFGKTPEQLIKQIQEDTPQALRIIQDESDRFTQSWQYLEENNPEVLDSFLELYELSDGKINSITKMNEDILNTFVRWRPLIDNAPDAPNILDQAVRANFFNSILSSVGTAGRALYGNLSGLVAEPISYFAGSMLRGDLKSVQRGWMAYSAILDTQMKALPYAGKLFMKASQNPNSVAGATRLDLVIKNENKLAQYKNIARVEADKGNYGFKFLVDQYENLQAMAADPVFRLTPNTFTGFDGFTSANLANATARFRAMDELERLGKEATPDQIKKIADKEYGSMFDENGIIVDEAVKYNTGEIALNLDTGLNTQLNGLLQEIPGLRPFIMFPGTMANMVRVADDYLPAPLRSFQRDVNELAYTSVETFMEQPELVEKILTNRGYKLNQMDETARLNAIVDLKNKTLGKKAIGTFVTSLAIGSVLKDKLFGDGLFSMTGDGSVDRQLQRSRTKNSNWKERSIIGPDGVRFTYDELLGPGLSNWVATIANIADNFDMLGEAATENAFQKAAFILAAGLTDQAGLSALRPLVETLSGNQFAATTFATGQINSLGPLGGLRNEFGKIIDGGLKDLNNDILSNLKNRNQLLGVLDPANRLPTVISPVTGEAPNKYTMLQRIFNTYSPVKVHPAMSKEEEFLYDIEYDVSSAFKKRNGVKLLNTERAELNSLMGKRGYFRDEIKNIMRTADARNTINELKEARRKGITSEKLPIGKYDQIFTMIDQALKDAEELAFNDLESPVRLSIEQRIMEKQLIDQRAAQGLMPGVDTTLNIRY